MTVQLPFNREPDHPLDLAPSLLRLQQDGVIHQVSTGSGELAWQVIGELLGVPYADPRPVLCLDGSGWRYR